MYDKRVIKAHELLTEIENLRLKVVCIANITNPYITDTYEKQMFNELIEIENLIQKSLERLRSFEQHQQDA